MDPSDTPLVRVLWSDGDIALVDKPPGMLVHRSSISTDRDVLLQRVSQHFDAHVHAVHRLDRAASGVVLFALNQDAARWAQAALSAPSACKEYLILARGDPGARYPDGHWESDRPLTNDDGVKQPCRSAFQVLRPFDGASLVRARTHTGRRHQLRRHLNHCGHHILGDTTHGKGHVNRHFREAYGLPRMFLHACWIEFVHGKTGAPVAVASPLPNDLKATLHQLPPPTDPTTTLAP